MRKIVVSMSISLDGYSEGPNHELDWQLVDDELHTHFNAELAAMSLPRRPRHPRADGRLLADGRRGPGEHPASEFARI